MPNNGNSVPATKILFSSAKKTHYNYVMKELQTQYVDFDCTKLKFKFKTKKLE